MAKGRAAKKKGVSAGQAGLAAVVGVVVLGVALFFAGDGKAKKKKAVTIVNDQVQDTENTTWAARPAPFFDGWTLRDVATGFRGIRVTDPKVVGFAGAIPHCDGDVEEAKDAPKKWDGRAEHPACFEGAVYDSKNCSSSYAIAAASALGQRFCIAEKDVPVRLSPQQVLSCDKKSKGCGGGGVDLVFDYINTRGLYPETCLPYEATGKQGTPCKTDCKESEKRYSLSHCRMTSEKALKLEIATNGPVVAPMLVTEDVLIYGDGVYALPAEPALVRDSEGLAVHVAVTIVGYGKTKGQDYWLIGNSWGVGWGESGYAKVSVERGPVLARQAVVVAPGTSEATAAKKAAEEAKEASIAKEKQERAAMKARVAQRQAERKAKGLDDPSVERQRQRRMEEDSDGVIFSDDDAAVEDDELEEEELG